MEFNSLRGYDRHCMQCDGSVDTYRPGPRVTWLSACEFALWSRGVSRLVAEPNRVVQSPTRSPADAVSTTQSFYAHRNKNIAVGQRHDRPINGRGRTDHFSFLSSWTLNVELDLRTWPDSVKMNLHAKDQRSSIVLSRYTDTRTHIGFVALSWPIDAWQSPACSPPGANAPEKLKDYWTELRQFFIRRRGIIGVVNACIRVAIFPSVVECQCTEWKLSMPIFADSRLNRLP